MLHNSIEKQVRTLTLELPSGDGLGANKSEQEDEEEDYEVQYDEDGNRIERPPAPKFAKRASLANSVGSQRRSSSSRPIMDTTVTGSPTQMVDSPVPLFQPQKRGSIGSIHSQQGHGHGHVRNLSLSSQPPPSPSFARAFPASYSPTIANASVPLPEGGSGLPNGGRPHSVHYANTSSSSSSNINNSGPPRPLTMDSNQLFRFHQNTNQFIPISPSAASTLATAASGLPPADSKKYVSMDDFEYMQAEVDTLRLNNDRLENMVRELTVRLNSLTSNVGQFYPG